MKYIVMTLCLFLTGCALFKKPTQIVERIEVFTPPAELMIQPKQLRPIAETKKDHEVD